MTSLNNTIIWTPVKLGTRIARSIIDERNRRWINGNENRGHSQRSTRMENRTEDLQARHRDRPTVGSAMKRALHHIRQDLRNTLDQLHTAYLMKVPEYIEIYKREVRALERELVFVRYGRTDVR